MNIDLVQLNFSTGYITGNNVSVSGSVIEELNVGGDLNLDVSGGTTFVSGANNISVTGDVNVTGGGIISGDVTGNVYITDSGIGYINSSSSVSRGNFFYINVSFAIFIFFSIGHIFTIRGKTESRSLGSSKIIFYRIRIISFFERG